MRCRDELTLLRTFVDKMGTGYATLWNAFKRITAGCSQIEKLALYSGTAKRLYHLD